MYLNYLKNEIEFCKTAISNIDEISKNVDEPAKMLFYHANVLFNSMANISKILNNNRDQNTLMRSQTLKKLLKIKNKKISILDNREYRNSNEHFDERIDNVLNSNTPYTFIDFSIFDYIITNSLNNFGRIYEPSLRTFYFINQNISQESINVYEIEKAITYLENQLNNFNNEK